jgi:hypothetical protein
MPLYNRYMVDQRTLGSLLDDQEPRTIGLGWDAAAQLIWGWGHLLNCVAFPFDGNIKPVPPPSGLPVHFLVPWSREDADLSSTLLISLSASTKTEQLIHNRPKTASPSALLAVASKPDPTTLCLDGGPFSTKAVTYVQARWPRHALLDLNSRSKAKQSSDHRLWRPRYRPLRYPRHADESGPTCHNDSGRIRSEVYTPAELAASQAEFKRLGKIQSNGSGQVLGGDVSAVAGIQGERRVPWYAAEARCWDAWGGWD